MSTPKVVFDMSDLPLSEHPEAYIVYYSIVMLGKYTRDFSAALALFDTSHNHIEAANALAHLSNPVDLKQFTELHSEWMSIAARDGAMTIYHFCKTFESIRTSHVPTMLKKVSRTDMESARQLVRGHFPDYESVRHGVSHTADFVKSLKSFKDHAVDGKVYIFGNLTDRKYTVTYEKSHFSYSINQKTLDALVSISAIVSRAYAATGFFKQSTSYD